VLTACFQSRCGGEPFRLRLLPLRFLPDEATIHPNKPFEGSLFRLLDLDPSGCGLRLTITGGSPIPRFPPPPEGGGPGRGGPSGQLNRGGEGGPWWRLRGIGGENEGK
jgi:hypothetical protein